jgi:predicted nucleotidyltransferase component of viral defense system
MEIYEYSGESMIIWKAHLIREKLILKSKEMGLRLPQMQMLLAQERFLARLFLIEEGQFFIWKGGSLFIREYSTLGIPRYTVEVDLLIKGMNYQNFHKILEKACLQSLEDGFRFTKTKFIPMERETPYGGDRFEIEWTMFDKAQSESLKLDICAGDVVIPIEKDFSDLTILSDDNLHLIANIYPAEFIFAEKLETIFRFGTGNTRFKDLLDIWSLVKSGIDTSKLKKPIEACFKNRNQKFSYSRLKEILEDDFFVRNMERIAEANFDQLKLVPIKYMMSDILKFCKNVKIE